MSSCFDLKPPAVLSGRAEWPVRSGCAEWLCWMGGTLVARECGFGIVDYPVVNVVNVVECGTDPSGPIQQNICQVIESDTYGLNPPCNNGNEAIVQEPYRGPTLDANRLRLAPMLPNCGAAMVYW